MEAMCVCVCLRVLIGEEHIYLITLLNAYFYLKFVYTYFFHHFFCVNCLIDT